VATCASAKIIGPDSKCPNSIDTADFEEEVLFGFRYLFPSNPKMFFHRDAPIYFNIQSSLPQVFSYALAVRCAEIVTGRRILEKFLTP
jgi:hypothetical protein